MKPCQEIGEDDIIGSMRKKIAIVQSFNKEFYCGSGPDVGASEAGVNKTNSLPFWSSHSR